ncbi:Ubiquitin carboxyl-terminal hydrolase 8 [Vitis vinifera]|uniref:Ubiquitin carboxyl-terminal hydrolase 8 n=1 Tax=Vitis vinifera TaxID=29760 RepID=A0A438HBB4_VITVI|nr:Ubiquitin carboxyl-terminal hydrolase 8 [Vitis vinifera]
MDAPSEDLSDSTHPQNDDVRVYFVPYRSHLSTDSLSFHFNLTPKSNEHRRKPRGFAAVRWWKEAQDSNLADGNAKRGVLYSATPGSSYVGPMKIINNIFNSDLVFNLRREEDSGTVMRMGKWGVREGLCIGSWRFVVAGPQMRYCSFGCNLWHTDSRVATKDGRTFSVMEDDMADVYPLLLRLSILRETNSLGVKITKKVLLLRNVSSQLESKAYLIHCPWE